MAQPPSGSRWVHEIKFDGYRTQLHLRPDRPVAYSRNGHDWTARYRTVSDALAQLPARHAVMDAEIVVPRADGNCDFWTLQKDVSAGDSTRVVAQCFDLMFLDGRDVRRLPLLERKKLLADLISSDNTGRLQFSDHVDLDGAVMQGEAHARGFEGVISKVVESPYEGRRVSSWVKSICQYRETLSVLGYAVKDGQFDGLYLAKLDGAVPIYGGKVEDGFDDALAQELLTTLEPFVAKQCTLPSPPNKPKARWLAPGLLANIVHRGGMGPHRVRHAKFDRFVEAPAIPEVQKPLRRTAPACKSVVPPENILQLLPDAVVPSREELRRYWKSIAADALVHLARRPLKLVRHVEGTTFYHKGPLPQVPRAVHKLRIRKRDGGEGIRLWIDDLAGLLGLVEIGAIELHPWAATIDDIERPDFMVFDLDPGEGIGWSFVVDTALRLRDMLKDEGFESWPKLTGGKGVHVMVPLEADLTHDQVHAYAKMLATRLAARDPSRYTTVAGAANRRGKLFIDYLRNGRGCTAIGTYSPRARAGLPVAAPINWKELRSLATPKPVTILRLPVRRESDG
jgi:bifunctional non-homologous end joining protein LigD